MEGREGGPPLPGSDSAWAWRLTDPRPRGREMELEAPTSAGPGGGGGGGGARPAGASPSRGPGGPGNRAASWCPGLPVSPGRVRRLGPWGCGPLAGGHSRPWVPWARLPGDPSPAGGGGDRLGPSRVSSRPASVGVWPPCLPLLCGGRSF